MKISPVWWVVSAIGAGGAGWFYWRTNERKKLAALLSKDALVQAMAKGFEISRKEPPPELAWVVKGDYAGRAEEALPLLEMITAEEAYPVIRSTLEIAKALPETRVGLQQMAQALEALGIEMPKEVDQALAFIDSLLQGGTGGKGGTGGSKPRPQGGGGGNKPRQIQGQGKPSVTVK